MWLLDAIMSLINGCLDGFVCGARPLTLNNVNSFCDSEVSATSEGDVDVLSSTNFNVHFVGCCVHVVFGMLA